MKSRLLPLVVALAAPFASLAAYAGPFDGPAPAAAAPPAGGPQAPTTAAMPHPGTVVERPDVLPLVKMMSYAGPIRLERTRSEASVPIPISPRMAFKGAKLRLTVSNSAALVPERSHLAIAINEQVVAQVPLDGAHTRSTYDIPLPINLMRAEFNNLTFRVAQHYKRDGCEDPLAPELWTRIDTERSAVYFDGGYGPLNPRLADLGELFGPKEPNPRHIALVAAVGPLLDDGALKAGSLIAQGIALRGQYIPLDVTAPHPIKKAQEGPGVMLGLDPATYGGQDAVVFGTVDQLTPYVRNDVLAHVKGPFLGVYPQDNDPKRVVVMVAGRDEKELTAAATALAFADSPYPETAEAVVRTGDLPKWQDYRAHNAVMPGHNYTFKDMGYRTRTMNGWDREEADLPVVLPPDLFSLTSDKLRLHLHYALGAGIQPGSGINILVNREFATAIKVDNTRASIIEDQVLDLPMKLFHAGENSITFATQFLPDGQGPCKPLPTDGLLMTMFSDSAVNVPDLPHFCEMPDLSLLSRAGFPYTRKPDGSDTRLWVGGTDSDTVGAAWTLMGRMAQTTGLPMFRSTVSFEPKTPTEDLLIVASRSSVPEALTKALAAHVGADKEELPGFQAGELGAARMPDINFDLSHASEELVTVSQVESPWTSGRTATLFSAASPKLLRSGMRTLVHLEAWGGLQGATTYWDPRLTKVAWRNSDEAYSLGHLGPALALERLATRYTVPFVGSVTLVGALVALGLAILLRRRSNKTHPDDAPEQLF